MNFDHTENLWSLFDTPWDSKRYLSNSMDLIFPLCIKCLSLKWNRNVYPELYIANFISRIVYPELLDVIQMNLFLPRIDIILTVPYFSKRKETLNDI
jgi:hypothetical protein